MAEWRRRDDKGSEERRVISPRNAVVACTRRRTRRRLAFPPGNRRQRRPPPPFSPRVFAQLTGAKSQRNSGHHRRTRPSFAQQPQLSSPPSLSSSSSSCAHGRASERCFYNCVSKGDEEEVRKKRMEGWKEGGRRDDDMPLHACGNLKVKADGRRSRTRTDATFIGWRNRPRYVTDTLSSPHNAWRAIHGNMARGGQTDRHGDNELHTGGWSGVERRGGMELSATFFVTTARSTDAARYTIGRLPVPGGDVK